MLSLKERNEMKILLKKLTPYRKFGKHTFAYLNSLIKKEHKVSAVEYVKNQLLADALEQEILNTQQEEQTPYVFKYNKNIVLEV